MTDPTRWTICKRQLNTGDVLAEDCGGDCAGCILQCEHDLPPDISDDELRAIEPELNRISERRTAEVLARYERYPEFVPAMQEAILAAIETADGSASLEVDENTPDDVLDRFLFGDIDQPAATLRITDETTDQEISGAIRGRQFGF